MCSTLSSCRLYSWMRLIWQSKIVSGSTAMPAAGLEPVGEALPWPARLACAELLAERRRRRPAGRSCCSCVEVGDPAVADRLGDQLGQGGVGHQQPAPRRDAVGLVVEALGEQLGEVGHQAACGAAPSGSPPRRWCCACRRWPGSPCAPCRAGPSSIRLMRASLAVVAGVASPHVVEEAAVDLVDDLQVARQQRLEQVDRPLLQRLGQQRVVRVGQRADASGPRPRPSRARPGRAGCASARRRPSPGACR